MIKIVCLLRYCDSCWIVNSTIIWWIWKVWLSDVENFRQREPPILWKSKIPNLQKWSWIVHWVCNVSWLPNIRKWSIDWAKAKILPWWCRYDVLLLYRVALPLKIPMNNLSKQVRHRKARRCLPTSRVSAV